MVWAQDVQTWNKLAEAWIAPAVAKPTNARWFAHQGQWDAQMAVHDTTEAFWFRRTSRWDAAMKVWTPLLDPPSLDPGPGATWSAPSGDLGGDAPADAGALALEPDTGASWVSPSGSDGDPGSGIIVGDSDTGASWVGTLGDAPVSLDPVLDPGAVWTPSVWVQDISTTDSGQKAGWNALLAANEHIRPRWSEQIREWNHGRIQWVPATQQIDPPSLFLEWKSSLQVWASDVQAQDERLLEWKAEQGKWSTPLWSALSASAGDDLAWKSVLSTWSGLEVQWIATNEAQALAANRWTTMFEGDSGFKATDDEALLWNTRTALWPATLKAQDDNLLSWAKEPAGFGAVAPAAPSLEATGSAIALRDALWVRSRISDDLERGIQWAAAPAWDSPSLSCVDASAAIAPDARLGSWVRIGPNVKLKSGAWVGALSVIGEGTKLKWNAEVKPASVVGADSRIRWSASVGPAALLGDRVKIGRWAKAGENFTAGWDSKLRKGVVVGDDTSLAWNVTLHKGAQLGNAVWVGQQTRVQKNSTIGHGTSIGAGVWIAKNVNVGWDVMIGNDVKIGKGLWIADNTTIEDGAKLKAPKNKNKNKHNGDSDSDSDSD